MEASLVTTHVCCLYNNKCIWLQTHSTIIRMTRLWWDPSLNTTTHDSPNQGSQLKRRSSSSSYKLSLRIFKLLRLRRISWSKMRFNRSTQTSCIIVYIIKLGITSNKLNLQSSQPRQLSYPNISRSPKILKLLRQGVTSGKLKLKEKKINKDSKSKERKLKIVRLGL